MAANSPPPLSEANPADERIHALSSERSWRGHRFRYMLASGFVRQGDVVVDAACGSGYGKALLGAGYYIGVDADLSALEAAGEEFIEADLCSWMPPKPFDVFVGFETIEHLPEFDCYLAAARQARRWAILSAPIVPTTHLNPWHLNNFAPGELAAAFQDDEWRLFQSVLQPAELSEIYVFERR